MEGQLEASIAALKQENEKLKQFASAKLGGSNQVAKRIKYAKKTSELAFCESVKAAENRKIVDAESVAFLKSLQKNIPDNNNFEEPLTVVG
jgi:hypothetical protein